MLRFSAWSVILVMGLLAASCGSVTAQPTVPSPTAQATPTPPTVASSPTRAATAPPAAEDSRCAVTLPGQAALPPDVLQAVEQRQIFGAGKRGEGLHGSGPLWVGGLPEDGVMVILGSEDGMGWKLGWWRREPGRLEMEGHRLNGPAPPAEPGVPDGYGDLGFQASGIGFPTEGCWEVVGRLGDDELRFVVRVVRGTADPKEALERFMEARLAGDEQLAHGLLARELARDLRARSVQILLTALSNPCWYRYEIDSLARSSGVRAVGRVRVFEHWWPGDSAGEIPHSWAQEIELEENAFSGWLVTAVGEPHDRRPEGGEPHGPNVSACRQAGSG